jgi:hypothetical protein
MKYLGDLQTLLQSAPEDLEVFRTEFGPASKKAEIQASGILAKEWKRVKKGEPGYRWAKAIALLALLVSIAACAILLLRTNHVSFSRARPWVNIERWQ